MSISATKFLAKVSSSLGHKEVPDSVPAPPELPDPIVRLVHVAIGLPELFKSAAEAAKLKVSRVSADALCADLIAYLQSLDCKKIGLTNSPLLEKLRVCETLREAGFDAKTWDEITLDEAYELDAGVTDVYAAISETGSLVIRPSAQHGRALSLVPPLHVAIVEPGNYLPDLVDLFEKLLSEGSPNVTLITGPSKTADIEGSLVVGVHGPGVVKVFQLG